ncbi:MFS general substrate transporter [Basidiobolus meristosporus CBS 931.73]|uniref:MFS general substrate transporter n=1 Tax=Basidiobolus meristosporus CBS 931.73 TaxID=1314790 RepID=A0A1Y1YXR3_9FUNG|nr:MFS general substrate transporter [Basidiobolus meristosporus CBS 931.73]|eukprot:ORY02828.1 MFS general substrate transporter [Basidiobolus meristosporus CBS 931.73]
MTGDSFSGVKGGVQIEKGFNGGFSPDPAAEKALVRKLDKRLIPFLSLLYLCSFLDRVNIGNAKLAHIDKDLALTGDQFNWSLSIFFIGYVLFEVPSNIMLKKIGPSRWIPIVMIAWSLKVAGLFPGVIFYLSLWYTRHEQALRIALFFGAATIAGAFGGVLAYGIIQMSGLRNLTGWQWIFIIEGLPSLLLAFVSYFYLPDFPESASFLTQEERELLLARLKHDAGVASETEFSWKQFKDAFIDWKIYMHMIVYIAASTPLYSLSLFLPSIVNGMGFTDLTAQLMSAPPYAVACVFTIVVSFHADYRKERGLHIAFWMFIGMIGYMLLIILRHRGSTALYIAAIITTTGVFANIPSMLSWFTNNIGGHTKRGVASALIISFGNIGGALGGQIYRADDAPENRRRDNLSPEQYEIESNQVEPADWHPGFRYIS